MSYQIIDGITFDDLLLVPQHSTVKSRSNVDLSFHFKKRGFETTFKQPIVPANMQSIMNYEMAEAIFKSSGLGLIHRFMPIKDQLSILSELDIKFGRMIWIHIGLSVGVKEEDKETIKYFVNNGTEILCVDVAHGDSAQCINMTEWIAKNYPEVLLISGNVATGSAARRLWEAGADIVKCGVGGGSLCTTRIKTGNGVPQLTALMDVAEVRHQLQELMKNRPVEQRRSFGIISDGGCKNSGDLIKSLCFADLVMTGNLFAGCEETPGNKIVINGINCKEYVGSSTHKTNHIEGIAAFVPCTEKYETILSKLLEGVRSGMSYQGAHNLTELKDNPTFIRITNAGLKESHPHDIILK
jgi:IMP dehydrogenase